MIDFISALKQNITGVVGEEEKRRALICAECPTKKRSLYTEILNAVMVEVDGYRCTGHCICPLATKIFAKEPENICPKWRL